MLEQVKLAGEWSHLSLSSHCSDRFLKNVPVYVAFSRVQTQVLVLVVKHFIHQAIWWIIKHPRKCLTPTLDSLGLSLPSLVFLPALYQQARLFVTSHFGCWRKSFRMGHLQEGDDARNPGARCLWCHCCHGHRQLQHHQSLIVFSFGEGHGILVQRAEFSTRCSS